MKLTAIKFGSGFRAAKTLSPSAASGDGFLLPSEGRWIEDEGLNHFSRLAKNAGAAGVISPLTPALSPPRGEGEKCLLRRQTLSQRDNCHHVWQSVLENVYEN